MLLNENIKYALFIGRWQPFHDGHKYIIDKAISEGKNVCIAIRDTPVSKVNPYTIEQRMDMINSIYNGNLKIIKIPDIESINIGRNVGYGINEIEVPENIASISGTNIRNNNNNNNNIPKNVQNQLKLDSATIWLTGLPCSGKTTLAKRLKEELNLYGIKAVHLDGDDVRGGINKDLDFSDEGRKENLRRVAHISEIFNKNGIVAIASFVSPTNKVRDMIHRIIGKMKLVYLKCSLEECKNRDVKGMYKKARNGDIKDFTGISSAFEEPHADLIVDTEKNDVEKCVREILIYLKINK